MVWKNKCKQIIMKAKFSMKDDPETLNEVLHYAKELDLE
jgi:predicted nucleotidyltransferase